VAVRRGAGALLATLAIAVAVALSGDSAAAAPEKVTIIRDNYGVPHAFGPTSESVSYGAGYALAQDRLWQMHAFRHIAKGRLSELIAPEESVLEIDKTVRFYTYTAQERARRYPSYPAHERRQLEAFVAGINAWIDEVNSDGSKMPFEFNQYGETPVPHWTVDDSLALQDVLILSFGSGGGSELDYAGLLKRLQAKLGTERGLTAFDDLVKTWDPDTPSSIPRRFKWRRNKTRANADFVAPRRALNPDARLGLAGAASRSASAAPARTAVGTAAQASLVPDPARALRDLKPLKRGLAQLRTMFRFGSNAQIVGRRKAESPNTLQTGGPQVGYLVPQWLADFGMHGGEIDATGMTFAGAGPAILIGRGKGYAWTTTTGSSDLQDTYVEKLNPSNPREYLYNGRYEPMECRTETHRARGGAPVEEQEICRTRHGPVLSFDEANNVAYSARYAWFNREHQTVDGFFRYQTIKSIREYATAANLLASNHNMFYNDDRGHVGYWHPGNHPLRKRKIDLRLPQDGTGGSEWTGLRPIERIPHAVDFRHAWLVNWNNQPSYAWRRERGQPARDNVIDLMTAFSRKRRAADPFGGQVNPDKRWDFQDLNANLRHAAFKDHRHTYYGTFLPKLDELKTDLARRAAGVVADWDGFLIDRNDDGLYDSAGTTILRRWLDLLRDEVFEDELGDDVGFARVDSELFQVLSPHARRKLKLDWTNGKPIRSVSADAFEKAVTGLAEEFGNQDPASWRRKADLEHYQRLNADLASDLATATACDQVEDLFGACPFPDESKDSGFPGDVPDHISMDRGTYNHIVAYLTRPSNRRGRRRLGRSRVQAGSVIPPGQSGFVTPQGEEAPHFEDQLSLYVNWRYKPMPMTLAEAQRLAESTATIEYSP
jgi:penicillin G amidase